MTLTNSQRNMLLVLIAVSLISLTVAAWAIAKWGFARSGKPDSMGGITVSDSAEVKVQPDTACITFGVIVKDKNAQLAGKRNATKTAAVIAAIIKSGIAKRDIKTVDYSLEPSMDWDKNPPAIVGYTASNSVRVRTKNLSAIGNLIDAATAAGANNVQGVSFSVEDKKALQQKALGLAVKKAEGKASAIANSLGVKLGPAISASENLDEYFPQTRNYNAYTMAKSASRSDVTPMMPGEASVSAQVKVVYSVR